MRGGDGSDRLFGVGGNDSLVGGRGSDLIDGGSGNDVLVGGSGDDVLRGGSGNDSLFGGAGIDFVSYSDSIGGVRVSFVSGVATRGDSERDEFSGIEGAIGGFGDDTFVMSSSVRTVDGGKGRDVLDYSSSSSGVRLFLSRIGEDGYAVGGISGGDRVRGVEVLRGGSGSDIFGGDSDDDTLYGRGGNDRLYASGGDDLYHGGGGSDVLSYRYSVGGVSVDLSLGIGYISGWDSHASYGLGVERGSDSHRIESIERIRGGSGDDTLRGFDGDETFHGGLGDDTIEGGDGGDRLRGGDGDDVLSYFSSDSGVTIALATLLAQGGHAESDDFDGFEHVTGSSYGDDLAGDALGNRLLGLGGDDTLDGGLGGDVLDGGDGFDTADYSGSASSVTIDLLSGSGSGSGSGAEGDTLIGIERVIGSVHDDSLVGSVGDNVLDGGAGSDTLRGGSGNDVLVGGLGGDVLDGGDGIDTADYSLSGSGVRVDLTRVVSGGDASGDVLTGIENVTGSSHDDTLRGDSGFNVFRGGDGDDWIEG